MPTLIASYSVITSAADTSTLTTPSFTPSNGEVIVVKVATWDAGTSMSTPTGGSQVYAKRAGSVAGGFRPYVAVYTATVAGSPGAMAISSTPSASSWHDMVVERWSGAQLAATPISDAVQGQGAPASSAVAGLTAGSVWSWVAGDAQSVDPATRAYLSSATEELCDDKHAAVDGVWYYAIQLASAGSNAYGLSAPTGMQFWIAGVEVLAAAGGSPITIVDLPAASLAASIAESTSTGISIADRSSAAIAASATEVVQSDTVVADNAPMAALAASMADSTAIGVNITDAPSGVLAASPAETFPFSVTIIDQPAAAIGVGPLAFEGILQGTFVDGSQISAGLAGAWQETLLLGVPAGDVAFHVALAVVASDIGEARASIDVAEANVTSELRG